MVATRSTDSRLDRLKKATGDLEKGVDSANESIADLTVQVKVIQSQLDLLVKELRANHSNNKSGPKTGPTVEGSGENLEPNTATTEGSGSLTMPTFDGSDAMAWLARAAQYFLVQKTPSENRVKVAMVALAGQALPWYQLLIKRCPTLSWAEFIRELLKRFGNNGARDEYEAFAAVRHTGTLAEFIAAFESRLAQVPDLAYHQYLGFFMAGLRPEVRLQMKAAKIVDYADAVQLALGIDQAAGNLPADPCPKPAPAAVTGQGRSFSKGYSQSFSSQEYKKHLAAGGPLDLSTSGAPF